MTSQTEENPSANFDLSTYRGLFLDQAQTFLTTLRQSLIRLKDEPADRKTLREAHRAAHTLKGMAATMRYEDLAALAKRLESPFLPELPLAPHQINDLLAGCDEFGLGLERLDKGDQEQSTQAEERSQ